MRGASFMTAILLFSMVFSAVSAAPPLPFERYGNAGVNSTYISSWIDGVEYGNCTTSGTGEYTIDTVSDDTVPDAIRTGGVNGDTIQYARTSLTGTAARFFTQTDTHVIGGMINGALTSEAADTPLLKIAILNPQPTVALMGDYIALYNPTGAPVDVTSNGWGIAIGAGATHTIVTADIMPFLTANNVDPIPATSLLYLNLSTAGWAASLSTTGNSIKLYYNTHIVDRVEYGTIATEPENTLMSNAALPAAGFEAYRTPAYTTDTNKCLPDFTTRAQTVPYDNTHPTITTIVPADGAVDVLVTSTVVVTWSEAMNPLVGSVNINPARTGAWAWSAGNTVYTFTPGGNWAYNTLYTLTFSAFTDVSGRAATGDLVKVFTTVVQASATATGPISATPTNVVAITITYTWTDTPTSVNLYYTMNGGTTWTLAGNDVTVNGNYAYTIVSGSGTYGWGASAVGGGSAEPSPITGGTAPEATPYILDVTAPTLTHVPTTGATGVATTANVVVTYSEAMNPAVIPTLTQTAGNPIVTFTWGGWTVGNTVATWTHATAWATGTLQTVQVSGGTDVPGNAAPTESWSFTTAAGATATATGPIGSGGAAIAITYTWTLTPTSVNLYYTTSTASPWTYVLAGNEAPDGSFAYTLPATGTYWFSAQAVGGGSVEPSPPAATTAPEAGSYTYGAGTPPPQVNDLNATHYGVGSTGILLQWTAKAGATSYVVYRTTSLNATWGWAQIAEVATLRYNDTTAYSNANNYTWVVHSKGAGGENMTKLNSLAYKCCYALAYSTTINGGATNWISLPYVLNITSTTGTIPYSKNDARALRDDITGFAGVTCSVVAWWDPTVGTRSWAGVGVAFALVPGRAYGVTVNAAGTYKMVGAYTPVSYALAYSATINGGASNRISLPYNMDLHASTGTIPYSTNDARALRDNVTGHSGATCSVVAWWDPTVGTRSWAGVGVAFALIPGRGYFVTINQAGTWACPVKLPGP